MDIVIYSLMFFALTCIGSFIGVCFERIPEGESIIKGRSHCESCGKTLKGYELVPIISYLFLRGRCSKCKKKIPLRCLGIEFFTAVFGIIPLIMYGVSVQGFAYCAISCILFEIALLDFKTMEISDFASLLIGLIGIAMMIYQGSYLSSLIGAVLKLIEGILPSADFIQYTASLNEEVKNDKFIRNYLYNLFISLDMNAQELQKIMPNEPTLEYFDSLAINASACLGRYDIYLEIKDKYGDEFLELLMDVQECIAMSLGMEYTRVTEETFDMGAMFFKDERFWCSSEEIKNSTDVAEERVVSQQKDEMIDVSKGNVTTWTNDQYLEEMYSDESENDEEKHYLDDDDVEEKNDTGLNMSEIDSYEGEELLDDKGEASSKSPAIVAHDDEIMNSQRGHESKVLNSGGM